MLDTHSLKKLAALAKISVSDEELQKLGGELGSILHFVDQVSSVASTETKNTAFVFPHNVAREDTVLPIQSAHDLVEAAPLHRDHFVEVPKVIGD